MVINPHCSCHMDIREKFIKGKVNPRAGALAPFQSWCEELLAVRGIKSPSEAIQSFHLLNWNFCCLIVLVPQSPGTFAKIYN